MAGLFYNVLILYFYCKTMRLSLLLKLKGVFVDFEAFMACKKLKCVMVHKIKKAATVVADLIKKNIHIPKEGNAANK